MPKYGPFTGKPEKPYSYQVGNHWMGTKGYRAVVGHGNHHHYFGGKSWDVMNCTLCHKPVQQLLSLDLLDSRLSELKMDGFDELPLVSCLNCSVSWEPQLISLNSSNKTITFVEQSDVHQWVREVEDMLPTPLPKVDLSLIDFVQNDIPTDEESYEKAFGSFGSEYLFRILGAPLLAQGPIDLECPKCGEEMKYVATITGEVYGESGQLIPEIDFVLGESYLYFMLCKRCKLVKTEMQGS